MKANKIFWIKVLSYFPMLLFLSCYSKQQILCNSRVLLDKYNGTIFRLRKSVDTIKINGDTLAIIQIHDCSGTMDIQEFSLISKKIIFEGHYYAWKDTTVMALLQTDPNDPMAYDRDSMRYLIPKRSGTWIYYDSDGRTIKKESYE